MPPPKTGGGHYFVQKGKDMTMSASDGFDLPFLRDAGVTPYGVIEVDDLDEYLLRHSTPETIEQTKIGPLTHPSAVHGLPRRLSAGLKSFSNRGWLPSYTFSSDGWAVTFSPYGHWSSRPWLIAYRDAAWVVAVGSAESGATGRQWTVWFGCHGVPSVIADRLSWRKAIDVCRLIVSGRTPLPEGWEAVPFEEDWHDIHGGTVGRWATPWGEVALKDDDDGRGYLTATTTARDGIAATTAARDGE